MSQRTETYASLRFARVVALSLGFFCPAAAFFCALRRSCSRWFPPVVPPDYHQLVLLGALLEVYDQL